MEITLLIFAGLVCILGGAEFLIRGSVRLAERMGISRLLIGLTVVGFGTSTPELVTSVQGALIGSSGVAVGNIVGSNIFNILVILGLAAMIHPLGVPCTALKRDGLFVVATALLFLLIGYAWTLDRVMAVVLLTLLAGYIVFAWRQERARSAEGRPTTAVANKAQALTGLDGAMAPGVSVTTRTGFRPPVAMVIGGLLLLIVGGRFFVSGAIELARLLNVGEAIIGLTIVAAGTSLPELATSLVAALRRQADMAIGNVLGSNVYNVLGIGGTTALIAPTDIPDRIASFDNLVMVGASVLLFLMMWTGRRIDWREGALLFAGFLVYLWALWPA